MGLFQWLYKLIFKKNSKRIRTENVHTSNTTRASEPLKKPADQKADLKDTCIQNSSTSVSNIPNNNSAHDAEFSKTNNDIRETKLANAADSTDAHDAKETVLVSDEPEPLACAEVQEADTISKSAEEDSVDKSASEKEDTDTTEEITETVAVSEETDAAVTNSEEQQPAVCVFEEGNASEENDTSENMDIPDLSNVECVTDEAEQIVAAEQLLCDATNDVTNDELDSVDAAEETPNVEPEENKNAENVGDEKAEEPTIAFARIGEAEELTDQENNDESSIVEVEKELPLDEEIQSAVLANEVVAVETEAQNSFDGLHLEQENEIPVTEEAFETDCVENNTGEENAVLPEDEPIVENDEVFKANEDIQLSSCEDDTQLVSEENAETVLISFEVSSPEDSCDAADSCMDVCDEPSASSLDAYEIKPQEQSDVAESNEMIAAEENAAAFEATVTDDTKNECFDQNNTNEQATDEIDNFIEEKGTTVPWIFDKSAERLRELRSRWYGDWPLRRLLAFGATQEEISNLINSDNDTFSVFDQLVVQDTVASAEKYAWLERIEDQAWKSAFEMCEAWQELLQKYSVASNIEHYRASGFSENLILAKTKLSSSEAQQLCKRFREAVLQWLNAWHAELGFLYNHSVLQAGKAEFFFGKLTFAIIRSVAEEAPNYGCAWLAYKELPFILWNPDMKMSKYSIAALAEETFRQLKTAESYDLLAAWFGNELHKKSILLPSKVLLNALLETKGVSPNDAIFKKSVSFHNVIKGDYTREADSTHSSMAAEWNSLAKWLVRQFNVQPMLGAIELYDDEYAVLIEDLPKRIHYLRSLENPEITDPLVCVELVQFAIRESKSGALWTKLGKLLCCKSTDPIMQWIGNLFIRTLTKYHKAVYEAGEKVASVLMHCFVCNAHIADFLDFLYAYYRLDLIRDTDQMDVAALRERMVNNERYSYSHLILQQTLDAMKYMPEISIARFEKYISWIDHAFWNIEWKTEEKGRFAQAFENWRSKHPDFNGSLRRHMSAAAKGKRYFSKPYLELDLRNGQFWLTLPVQKLRFGMEEGACWKMKADTQQTFRCELIEAVTCYHTEEIRIPLKESALLSEMTFELFANGKTKHQWTIEADCYRAFDENGQLISDAHLETGTVYLFTNPGAKIQTQASCTQQMHGSWLLSVYDFSEGDVVGFPDGTVTIVGDEMKEGLCGTLPVENAQISLPDGTKLSVYAEKPLLLLQTSDEHFSTGRMLINGSYRELTSLAHQSYALKNRTDERNWLITLPETADGIYQIQVDIAGEKDQRIWQFAVVPGLYYSFEGELPYWNQTVGKMILNCAVPFQPVDMEFVEDEFCYHFELSAKRQENILILDSGLQLSIRIPMICWRVPGGEWSIVSPGDLWHTEFPDKIELRSPVKQITVSIDDEQTTDRQHSVICNAIHGSDTILCDMLPLRSWLTRSRIRHSVYFTVHDVRRVFAQVYRTTLLEFATFEPDFENNLVKGFFDVTGKGTCVVSVSQNGNIVAKQIPITKGVANIPLVPDPGTYQASIYEAEADEFGFDETLYSIGEYQFKIKDPGDITGMTGYLKEVEPTEEHPDPLVFRHKYYWLDILERDPNHPNRYAARLREDDDFAKMFRKYHSTSVIVTLPNRTNIRRVRITYPTDLIPRAFCYEPKSHCLVKREKAGPNAIKLDSLDIFHIKFVEKV